MFNSPSNRHRIIHDATPIFGRLGFMSFAGISAADSNNGTFFDVTRSASGGWGFGNSDLTDTLGIAISTVSGGFLRRKRNSQITM
jgi:hypothetical protein